MKTKTILALCLFALSPVAMASNHASHDCAKHHQAQSGHADHAKHETPASPSHGSDHKKTCAKHAKKANVEHSGHGQMSHAEHMKMMGDKCDKDHCDTKCDHGDAPCDNQECKEHCQDMHAGASGGLDDRCKSMDHGKAADTCHTDDCSKQCDHGKGECMDDECKEHCQAKDLAAH